MGYAKRQLARGLLFVHFLGLTLSLGAIFTNIIVERHTRGGSLEMLSIGRDLVTLSSHNLIQTGFLIAVFSGILLTLLRYGVRAPLWVWIKLGISVIVLTVVIFALDPAGVAATEWARWSAEHGQLAPQYLDSVTRSGRYGIVVLALLLVMMTVAIWKPAWSGLRPKRDRRSTVSQVS
jgi:hypothetical protein